MAGRTEEVSTGFTYQQLAASDIRLLCIEDSPNEDELVFSLAHHPRDNAPSYVALSYYWGTEPSLHKLLINGHHFFVRPTLWQALYHITTEKEARSKEWRYIWCDAVCVNQENIGEKNEQVLEMFATYSNASVVVAWIGPDYGGKYDQEAIRAAESRAASNKPSWLSRFYEANNSWITVDVFKNEIFQRPYIHRMWVIQELIAARKFVPLFGRSRFTFQDLVKVNIGLASKNVSLPFRLFRSGFITQEQFFHEFFSVGHTNTNKHRLEEWISVTSESLCTDPKDRIFSLLSILPVNEREILYTFFPDYALSLERIQLITLAFLRQEPLPFLKLDKTLKNLHIYSKSLGEELISKSEPRKNLQDAKTSHFMWTMKHPLQTMSGAITDKVADEEYISARTQELRIVASKPLSSELDAHRKLLRGKPWYLAPE